MALEIDKKEDTFLPFGFYHSQPFLWFLPLLFPYYPSDYSDWQWWRP